MESSKPALKRKRRPAGECPNPLFVKWVEEWRDEAREEGSKVQYAYTRALNSLKKYPLPLVSGQEAKILDHIGEKLAKKLDRRLAQHRAEEGIAENSGSMKRSKVTSPKAGEGSRDQGDIQPTKGKRKRAQAEYVPEYRSGPYGIIIALYRAQQKPNWIGHLTKTQLMSQAQPFSDKSFTIPDDGKYYTAWSSMATLIRKGLVDKRSCPAKFRLTEAGGEMAEKLESATSTLTSTSPTATQSSSSSSSSSSTATISRDCNMAEKERRGSLTQHSHSRVSHPMSPPAFSPSPPPPSLKSPNTPPATVLSAAPTISLVSDSDDSSDIEILPPPLSERIQTKTRPPRSFRLSSPTSPPLLSGVAPGPSSQRWSVEETPEHSGGVAGSGGRGGLTPAQMAGRAALCRLQASSSGGDGGGGRGGGERRIEEKNRGGARRKAKEKTRGKSKKNDSEFSGRVDLTLEKEDLPVSKKRRESDDDEDLPDFPLLTKARPGRSTQTHRPTLTSPPPRSPPFHRSPTLSPSSPLSPNSRSALGDITSTTSKSLITASSNTTSTAATTVSKSQTRSPLFRLRPGEYEVVLCVDNAESTACRKSSSQFRGILLQELAKNGVRFDVRKLNVGDFLWIAKEKAAPLQGQLMLPQSREVVLEYIVERKRMDDLAGSITDKRFHEQKFRLRHCGVRQPMYLVEEFGDKIHLKLPVRSLEQAISNTQVIDGFTVHRTTDIRESVVYLTLLTRQLCRHYAGKTVEAFPWDIISDLNKPPPLAGEVMGQTRGPSIAAHLTDGATVLGMEFSSFNEASVKNKTLTAYEMFGRHLMQVPAVSAERAAAILDHFPTISALRDAYRECESSSKRETLISSLKAGQTRSMGKNIGSTLSHLYWGQ